MTKKEKHSDRFEIRLAHTKKKAFIEACENQSDTPSSAVRRFIDSYIRRSKLDAFSFSFRLFRQKIARHWFPISALCVAIISVPILGSYGLKHHGIATTEEIRLALFNVYDSNANGLLELGEISERDEAIHRVIDIDKIKGISPEEFKEQGKMLWAWGKNKDDMDSSFGLKNRILVNFDIEDPEDIIISNYGLIDPPLITKDTAERLVIWDQTTNRASLIMNNIKISNNENGHLTLKFDSMVKRPNNGFIQSPEI